LIAVNSQPVFVVAFWALSKMGAIGPSLIFSNDPEHWMGTVLTCECGIVPKGIAWNIFSLGADTSKPCNLHRLICSSMAADNVLRTQADTVCLLALAAVSTRLRSSGLNRTGTMVPLASAFASRGRPGFLGFGFFADSGIGS